MEEKIELTDKQIELVKEFCSLDNFARRDFLRVASYLDKLIERSKPFRRRRDLQNKCKKDQIFYSPFLTKKIKS